MFAGRLRSLRENTGLKQLEAANKLNMAKSTYNNYETGKREPDLQTLRMFADYFNVTTDYLLGRTDNPRTVSVTDIPKELKALGVEYYTINKEAKDKDITPEQLKRMIKAIEALKET
jgi:transcriptional regulator with XRE-family HTH domain